MTGAADEQGDELLDLLVERLAGAGLADTTASLVLAAALGDEELNEALGGHAPISPEPSASSADGVVAAKRTYLSNITVNGFRGIAGEARLGLTPGPGLTLVVGRNGSGKSTFAEACELALTGTSMRWSGKKNRVWQDGWANLHHEGPRSIAVDLLIDGRVGTTRIRHQWGPSATDVDAASSTMQAKGEQAGPMSPSMAQAVASYRPFLSYNELGGLLEDGPSRLYDAVAHVLGLQLFVDAEARLTAARRRVEQTAKEATRAAAELAPALAATNDDRAARCLTAIKKRGGADLDAIETVLAEDLVRQDEGSLALLVQLAALTPPDEEEVIAATDALAAALDVAEATAATESSRARGLADLLQRALDLHAHESTSACPVCGTSAVLDDDWTLRTRAEIATLTGEAAAADRAESAIRTALARAAHLHRPAPAPLATALAAGVDGLGVDVGPAAAAWGAWSAAPSDPRALVQHLRTTVASVGSTVRDVATAATIAVEQRQSAWQPLRDRLTPYLELAGRAAVEAPRVKELKAGCDWVRALGNDVQNERFEPIAKEVQDTWNLLRQQSNVAIADITLRKVGVRRSVELSVTVDETEGAALAVMSQGELHALALSLFLPRATLPQSPFGFIVIDDPVQSMDAARVDGLARALARAAKTHQVVVFTHDERLPQATRSLRLDATVLEVTRGERSEVTVRPRASPSEDYISDARAVLKTEGYPVEVRRRVVPGLCRSAVEAACIEVARRRLLEAGTPHEEVTLALTTPSKLLQFLALGLFADAERAGDVFNHLNTKLGRTTADAISTMNKGTHELVDANPAHLIDTAEKVARHVAQQR